MVTATSLRFYDVVVFLHVFAVVVAFGVTFTYGLSEALTTRTAPDKLPWLHRLEYEIGRKIVTPAGTVVLLAGLYLALAGDGPFDLKDWWVGFGLLSILVILGLNGAYFSPRERRLSELAERDLAAGGLGPEYRALSRQVAVVGGATGALILITVLLMVLGARGVFT